ncbi:MAG: hypothetical protein A3D94_12825 [Alphaproteobacteria bacterium RIFCSPHIGHO2_12_FULL_66_14]|jgi:uncharacterized protein (DUF2141 family)|nr:MAG: hypothetical protein A3D94_12825 [Alphaproteobacteria bacterium RIFCSPHIGHO2_12_FULL_66_14]
MTCTNFGLAFVLAAGFGIAAVQAQQGNTISVNVTGLRNNNGDVRCGLYNSAATFPKSGQEFKGVVAPISGQQATCVFGNVAPGVYAVALFHAEKGETKMRTGFFGQPEEGYGFSRNAKGSMGPPAFNAAAYTYSGGATNWPVTITYP